MDTSRYKAFAAAAETGSFSRAAEVLSYSPSGVSQLINALEADLGVTLLRRTSRGVSLSPAGETLLPAVRALLQQEERVFQLSSEINGLMTGELNIASYSSVSFRWLPKVIKAFQQDHPNVRLHLMEGISQEVLRWLGESKADIGFLSWVKDCSYEWIPLSDDPMIAILPRNHPYANADVYPLAECEHERFIMPALGKDSDVVDLLARFDLHPTIVYSTIESFSAFAMIENGLGMTITNQLITEGFQADVVKLPLDPPQHIHFGIMIPNKDSLSPAAKRFVAYARKTMAKRSEG
ncbi:MAG: LysR family transcriptional regulator [Oscillospiraceae bacterium]|nr:LysR family transcriptional regulator [Oscillospiraceae bacterium]